MSNGTGEIRLSAPCQPSNKQVVASAHEVAVGDLCKCVLRQVALWGACYVLDEDLIPEFSSLQQSLW